MDKPLKIVIFIVLGLVIFHLLFDIFGSQSHIKQIKKNLELSKKNVDSALSEIKYSQERLNAMQEDLIKFSFYIKDIQGRVELNDNEKRKKEARSQVELDSLKALIKKGKLELKLTDSLPEIIIKDLK
ncbi:MAG: hypothetical protein ACRDEB_09290 [Chitinophagaceae bacterium]